LTRAARAGPAANAPAIAAFRYEGVVRSAIHQLKFRGIRPLAGLLGGALAAALADLPPGPTLVVPVPLHWRRRWSRGHNQSVALARTVAAARPGFRYLPVLRKRRATPAQTGLDARVRRANVSGVFAVRRSHTVAVCAAQIIVVDDVVTTGATLEAARRCLLRAGAAAVTAAAVAAAPPPGAASGLRRGELGHDIAS
jgi:ComF family protein